MAGRYPNPNLVKIHRSYTVEEVASLCDKHKNTVRAWIKEGLPVCDAKRPTLILGNALKQFLSQKRMKNKQSCRPGQMYCVKCKVVYEPAGEMADCQRVTDTIGNLVGICPVCHTIMNRRISLANINQVRGNLEISFVQGLQHINERSKPSINHDFRKAE